MSALAGLLRGLVDYAGLFPPAALPMPQAVANYARYRSGAERAMLARFVVPAARLGEFARALIQTPRATDDVTPWPLAVLATAADAPALAAFDEAHGARARVDTIEAKADEAGTIGALAAAYPRHAVYVEVGVREDPTALLAAIKAAGLRAKIRTGGVVAEAFPSPDEVLRFLSACAALDLPFKATAGLHHPLRGEYPLTYQPDAVRGAMYGYLNVYLTALMLRAGHAPASVAPLLEEREASALRVTDSAVLWRGHALPFETVLAARAQFAGSFGSCSFEEPVTELAALSLLPSLS